MTPRAKAWLSGLVRYGICVAALGWLAYGTDWVRLKHVLAEANWRLALVGLLAYGPAPIGLAIRLKVLLAAQNVHISLWQATRVTFAGNFIIAALPVGTPGGDSAKAYYVARETPHKHEAVTTVFFDRVVGLLGLILMSGFMVAIDWHNPAFRTWGRPIALLFVLIVFGMAVGMSRRLRRLLLIDRLLAVMPFSAHIQRVDRAVLMFRHYPRRLIASLLLSFVLQVVSIVSMYLTGWALGLVGDNPWRAFPVYLAYTPIAFLAGVFPLGIMEVTYRQLLADAAKLGSPEAAISLSFLCRIIQLVWALPGILVVLKSRPKVEPDLLDSPDSASSEP